MGIRKKKIEIGPDTVLQRRNDLLFNEIDGEVVMLSVENSEYYGINKVGSRIWELLEQPIQLEKLICKLENEYSVTKEQCANDINAFIQKLIEKSLVIYE